MNFFALLVDATPFAGQQMVAALGIGQDGREMILGIRQGATGNATMVGELLGNLMNRGFGFTVPRLCVLDGGMALHAAVKKYAAEPAAIQRCQVHKRRNVRDHLTGEQKPAVAQNAAYAREDYSTAKQALHLLYRELMDLNPSAARSLGEGLEESLTVHRLGVPLQLRQTLASTNVIESAFPVEREAMARRRSARAVGGLWTARRGERFRRVKGHKHIPFLIRELEVLASPKREIAKLAKHRKAS